MSEFRSLVPDVSAPVAARRALDRLRSQIGPDVFKRSTLVATELVSNSVMHAGLRRAQRIVLEIAVSPECLRMEVTDAGRGFEPVAVRRDPGQESGWGLLLVEQLTDRWGVDCTHSTRVWCEFDRSSD